MPADSSFKALYSFCHTKNTDWKQGMNVFGLLAMLRQIWYCVKFRPIVQNKIPSTFFTDQNLLFIHTPWHECLLIAGYSEAELRGEISFCSKFRPIGHIPSVFAIFFFKKWQILEYFQVIFLFFSIITDRTLFFIYTPRHESYCITKKHRFWPNFGGLLGFL